MTIDASISESAIDKNERAVIEKYGFDVKNENGHFVVIDPVYRKANRGSGGKYGPGGNIELLLRAAVSNRQSANLSANAPSDNKKGKKRANTTKPAVQPEAAKPADEGATPPASSDDVSSSQARDDTGDLQEVSPTPSGTSAPNAGDMTEDESALVNKYHLTVSTTGGSYEVKDPAVAAFYAFRDASKKGVYVGTDRQALLLNAAEIHEAMIAEQNGVTKTSEEKAPKKTKEKAPKKVKEVKEVKEKAPPKPRKDNRFLRAFRVLAAQPDINAADLGHEAEMSAAMASWCISAWKGVAKIAAEKRPSGNKPTIGLDDNSMIRVFRWLEMDSSLTAADLATKASMAVRTATYSLEAWTAAKQILAETK